MNLGLELLFNNLGMGIGFVIALVLFLGSLLFFAKDFKLGLVGLFVTNALGFLGLYAGKGVSGWEVAYIPCLVVMLISLVILAFSLWPVSVTADRGGFV